MYAFNMYEECVIINIVYGAISGVSVLLISAIVGVVCVGIYIKYKHKGTVIVSDVVLVLYEQSTLILTRSFGEHSNGSEPCI